MGFYKRIENYFERLANILFRIFSNSLMFIAAVILTIVWFAVQDWRHITISEGIEHVMIAITFLGFFIIQRAFAHFSQALHLKINELVATSERAHNHVILAEHKSGEEMKEMAKEHHKIIEAEKKEEGVDTNADNTVQ